MTRALVKRLLTLVATWVVVEANHGSAPSPDRANRVPWSSMPPEWVDSRPTPIAVRYNPNRDYFAAQSNRPAEPISVEHVPNPHFRPSRGPGVHADCDR